MRNAKCKLRNSKFKIQNSKVQGPLPVVFRILHFAALHLSLAQRMTRRDLRPTPAPRELAQRLLQRQSDLFRIPAARQARRDRLPIVEFDAEAGKAERPRTILAWCGIVDAKPISRLVLAAAGT
jgi:hypothetical protein